MTYNNKKGVIRPEINYIYRQCQFKNARVTQGNNSTNFPAKYFYCASMSAGTSYISPTTRHTNNNNNNNNNKHL